MAKKIVYIISGIDKALAFEWIANNLKSSYDLTFIFFNDKEGETQKYLVGKGIECYHLTYRGKKKNLHKTSCCIASSVFSQSCVL